MSASATLRESPHWGLVLSVPDPSRPGSCQRHRELDVSGREEQDLEGWDSFHKTIWLPALLVKKNVFAEEVPHTLPPLIIITFVQVIFVLISVYDFENTVFPQK